MTTKYQAGARVSEYVLETCVGAGTFGEVWQARHHVWEQERVAIKLPTEPEYVRYLQREGVVVHGLRHPNIVRVLGLDPYAETPYLVMELVKGPSLREVLNEHPQGLPLDVVWVVLRGLLRAMGAAHDAHVIHRDLKPGNVLLHLDGHPLQTLMVDGVKVGDFGLGVGNADALRSMIEQSASIERDAQSQTIAGTLAYMAPEVRDGEQPPSARSDLYAVGVILFEILTGERPAGAEVPSALRADTPVTLDRVFRRLYTRYENRYDDAHAVMQDLEEGMAQTRADRRKDLAHQTPEAGGRSQARGRVPPPPPGAALHPHVTCPRCTQPVDGQDQFCQSCGLQLAKNLRRCMSCGGYPGPEDRYCIFCGTALTPTEV